MATIPKPTLAAIRELGQALVTSNAQTRQDIQHMLSNVVFQFQPGERNRALYEQDFYAWTQTTAERIRAGQWYDLDREALAEEVESLGRSERNALESRLERLVLHLLKWRYQPDKRVRGHSWEDTIREQRRRISRLLSQNPSLSPKVPIVLTESYSYVRQRAQLQTRLPLSTFPETCPWTAAQILDDDFWPEGEPTP